MLNKKKKKKKKISLTCEDLQEHPYFAGWGLVKMLGEIKTGVLPWNSKGKPILNRAIPTSILVAKLNPYFLTFGQSNYPNFCFKCRTWVYLTVFSKPFSNLYPAAWSHQSCAESRGIEIAALRHVWFWHEIILVKQIVTTKCGGMWRICTVSGCGTKHWNQNRKWSGQVSGSFSSSIPSVRRSSFQSISHMGWRSPSSSEGGFQTFSAVHSWDDGPLPKSFTRLGGFNWNGLAGQSVPAPWLPDRRKIQARNLWG